MYSCALYFQNAAEPIVSKTVLNVLPWNYRCCCASRTTNHVFCHGIKDTDVSQILDVAARHEYMKIIN